LSLYNINRNKILELRRYLDKNFNKDFIRVNRFYTAFFILFVKKPSGGLRFYVNYRGLNIIIIKNKYSLPLILEILNRLSYIKVFFKLDIISIFNRLRVKEGNEEFIIFHTRFGLFEYFIILFRLYNNPTLF
jgi:hypothetical protein